MASINPSETPLNDEQAAWNQAYDRLRHFLESFALGDRTQIPRLALQFLEEARKFHREDPKRDPVALTMEMAQKHVAEWFAANLDVHDKNPSQVFSSGYLALLFSQSLRATPGAFLTSPLPENLRRELRETLLITGPDLNISRMTPRHLDYGPMVGLARTTWQRWNLRELVIAILFWTGVYFAFYWWLSDIL
jgi:hypothetical protein